MLHHTRISTGCDDVTMLRLFFFHTLPKTYTCQKQKRQFAIKEHSHVHLLTICPHPRNPQVWYWVSTFTSLMKHVLIKSTAYTLPDSVQQIHFQQPSTYGHACKSEAASAVLGS
jgi:hypothetical protein